jgi:hypothetical protein
MRKAVSIGLLVLLLYHALSAALVWVGGWWQAQQALTQRLVVYRATDSLVEFHIPLQQTPDGDQTRTRTSSPGFAYRGQYFDVVSLAIRGDTLLITAITLKPHSVWQADLLSFVQNWLVQTASPHRNTNHWLKLLLQEYTPNAWAGFRFLSPSPRQTTGFVESPFRLCWRALPPHSPPPEA